MQEISNVVNHKRRGHDRSSHNEATKPKHESKPTEPKRVQKRAAICEADAMSDHAKHDNNTAIQTCLHKASNETRCNRIPMNEGREYTGCTRATDRK